MSDIQISEEGGTRYLHFDSDWIQGAMRIARPHALELEYTREMMACLLWRADPLWPRRALLIGLGAGSLVKFLRRHRPACRIRVVEIDTGVVAAARQYFALPDTDTHLAISIGDGADALASGRTSYDLIMIDAFDADGRSGRLDSLPCYADARARLTDRGLVAVNFLSRRRGHMGRIERLGEAFADRILVLPANPAGNVVAFAASGRAVEHDLGTLRGAARALKRDTGLNLLPTLDRLAIAGNLADGLVRF